MLILAAMWALHIAAKFGISNYSAASDVVKTVLNSDPSLTDLKKLVVNACGRLLSDTEDNYVVETGSLCMWHVCVRVCLCVCICICLC